MKASSSPFELTIAPAPPTGGQFDWHPGHYIAAPANTDPADVSTVCGFVNARSYLRGVVLRPYWRSLETARGVYDFSLVDQAITALGSGKHVWLQLQTAAFNNPGAGPSTILPDYLVTGEFDGGAYDDGNDVKTKVWNAAVMDRKIALMQALAAKYDANQVSRGC